MTHRTWRIGLTGGIGCGKSTVARFFANKGAAVIDADAISRQLTAPGGRALHAISNTFGAQMIGPDGAMNRQSMRTLIFRDPEAKLLLEQIIHPLVSRITAEQALAATQSGRNLLIFDVPLLVESGDRWRQQLDRVVVIDCDEATQRQRVMLRSGLSDHEVQSIMSQQASREQRLSCADVVIVNQHLNFDELEALVAHVALDFGL